MKKLSAAFLCGVIAVLAVSCNKEKDVPVTSVSLSQPTAEMIIGETVQLSATVLPSDATDKSVTWASSKQSVATVSSSGMVTAVAEGVSTITASSGGKSASCTVTVSKGYVAVTSVTLNKTELALEKGQTETLTATVAPDDATDKTVTWNSSASSIVSVDNSGKVSAVAGGSAVITAKAGDKQATCTVTVTVPVESISLDRESVTLEEESSTTLVATVKPDDATNKTVTWSSSNNEIAAVDETGKVTAIKEGEATITARAGEKTATCKVTVQKRIIAVTSITLNKEELILVEGNSETLVATVLPEDATDKTVSWSSSEPTIATVDDGLVTAVKEGKATIAVSSGAVKAICEVVVITPMDVAISFADPKIKAALVKAFDKNNDGELSYAEAAAVESIEGAFGTERDFSSFNEFQYFTGVTTIPNNMFSYWQSLSSIILPKGITSIEVFAFCNCQSLQSIVIPEGVTGLYDSTFYECKSLTSIVLPESLGTIGDKAFWGCASLASIEIPSGVTEISDYCFTGCHNLSSISLPNGIRSIGEMAFNGCAITTISIPERVRTIGMLAFSSCENLTEIEIPNGVTSLYSTFYGCKKLVSVILPETITQMNGTFSKCTSLSSIELPKSLRTLHGAFDGCSSLSAISIPNGVTDMAEAFRDCSSLTSIELPVEGYDYITFNSTFSGCSSLTSVTLPQKVRELNGTFNDCVNLTSITIPQAVIRIGENAFSNCVKLGSIDIPKNVSSIGYRAFNNCSGLQKVIINLSSVPSGDYDMFLGSTCPIYVPATLLETYKKAKYWSEYADRLQVIGTPLAVDLGLSVKWASWNIGASEPEDYGDYYAWGETEPKSVYDWSTYKWCNGSEESLTKYNYQKRYGVVDNKSVLEAEDDVAHVILGGNWRMPTHDEWTELLENCTWTWTTQNGVSGRLITSKKNDRSIFLPAAGSRSDSGLIGVGSYGNYWSSSRRSDVPSCAWSVFFNPTELINSQSYTRRFGLSVRPVTE